MKFRDLNNNSKEILNINNSEIIILNLSYNNLTFFPDNLLKLENLISLDIRKNKFENIDDLIKKISEFKYLSELKFDFSSINQVENLLLKSPQIIFINGKNTKDFINNINLNEEEIEKISLEQSLQIYNNIFTDIQTQFQKNNSNLTNDFHNQFQNLINDEASNINNSSNKDNYVNLINVFKSEINILKFLLHNYLSNIEYLKDKREEIGNIIINNFNNVIDNLFKCFSQINDNYNKFNSTLRKQIEIILNYINEENESSNKIEKIKKELNKQLKIYKDEKDFYLNKIERLEIENKYMTEHLIKLGLDLSKKINKEENMIKNNKILKNNNLIEINGSKNISIKNLNEIINEIYNSKIEYDKKCFEYKIPKVTIEQHMYNYLNNKYGLKNIVIEWTSSILLGINIYSNEDSDINLFGKIYRNEIDENERFNLFKLKNSINEFLELYLMNKNPLKNRNEIHKIYLFKLENFLIEDEWKFILYSIYSKEEGKIIEKRILNIINELNNNKNKKKTLNDKNKKNIITREEYDKINLNKLDLNISFKEFVHIITDYQICYREKYLKNFLMLYKQYDTDSNGIINEEEFINLCSSISYIKNEGNLYIKKLLNKIDPYNFKSIIYNDCIKLFSSEIIEIIINEKKTKITLLDNLCINEIKNQ